MNLQHEQEISELQQQIKDIEALNEEKVRELQKEVNGAQKAVAAS